MVRERDQFGFIAAPEPLKSYFQFLVAGSIDFLDAEILVNDVWTTSGVPPLPHRIYLTCVTYRDESTLMLIGGMDVGANYAASQQTFYLTFPSPQWTPGPLLQTGRMGSLCERIISTKNSPLESIIVVGGMTSDYLLFNSVELLDDGSSAWRDGPSLDYGMAGMSLVRDPNGGIIIVGGIEATQTYTQIMRLQSGDSSWETLPQKLSTGRFWASAFAIPDGFSDCV